MPTVLGEGPYRFYFHSHEPNKPPHVHVDREERSAKFWLQPVGFAWNFGFDAAELRKVVDLRDGRTIAVPLVWYPRLLHATPQQRSNWKLAGGGFGIHWPEIDEDLSVKGLLRGAPAPRASTRLSA